MVEKVVYCSSAEAATMLQTSQSSKRKTLMGSEVTETYGISLVNFTLRASGLQTFSLIQIFKKRKHPAPPHQSLHLFHPHQ